MICAAGNHMQVDQRGYCHNCGHTIWQTEPSSSAEPELEFCPIRVSGTSLRGYLSTPWSFEETVARLLTLAPKKATEFGIDGKVSVEVTGLFRGQPFTIYDWKGGREQLHLGGTRGLDVLDLGPALVEALTAVTPEPVYVPPVDAEYGGAITWPA